MPLLKNTTFVCLDCETTGLDTSADRIVEIAVVKFNFQEILDSFESLVDPQITISDESLAIHHISHEMIVGKPTIDTLIPQVLEIIGDHVLMGHVIRFDIDLVTNAAIRAGLTTAIADRPYIDTLRLARHYGDSPNNTLENLAKHFNVPIEGAHRAMNDVMMNIGVFKQLVRRYDTLEQVMKILAEPIKMKYMPLGKHKGRLFSEIPLQYLQWASQMEFDQDLLFTLRSELRKRRQGGGFKDAANPFSGL